MNPLPDDSIDLLHDDVVLGPGEQPVAGGEARSVPGPGDHVGTQNLHTIDKLQ